jgi:hypothetical protein
MPDRGEASTHAPRALRRVRAGSDAMHGALRAVREPLHGVQVLSGARACRTSQGWGILTRTKNKKHCHYSKRRCGLCSEDERVKHETIEKRLLVESEISHVEQIGGF